MGRGFRADKRKGQNKNNYKNKKESNKYEYWLAEYDADLDMYYPGKGLTYVRALKVVQQSGHVFARSKSLAKSLARNATPAHLQPIHHLAHEDDNGDDRFYYPHFHRAYRKYRSAYPKDYKIEPLHGHIFYII